MSTRCRRDRKAEELQEGGSEPPGLANEVRVIAGEGMVFAKLWMWAGAGCVWGITLNTPLPELC